MWLFHNASEYGVVPPTLKIVAAPLSDGEFTFCVIENEIPSQGDGEQSTKFGGPCPYCPQPPAFCKFPNEVPGFVVLLLDDPPLPEPLPLPDPPLVPDPLPEPLPLPEPPPLPEVPELPDPPLLPLPELELLATEIFKDFC
jgi:hypothetical protein